MDMAAGRGNQTKEKKGFHQSYCCGESMAGGDGGEK